MDNKKIKLKYTKSYDFKVSLATGVQGGVATNGLISMNFFIDRPVIPDSQIIEVDEKGKQIGQPIDEKDGDILREVFFGVLLDINSAKTIAKWLEAQAKNFEEISLKR